MASILVLDDDQDYCEEIELALRNEEHEILTAKSSAEAISLGITHRPELLITDWMLRENMDGLSVAEVIEILCPNIPVVLITGYASGDLRNDAEQQEVFGLLEKPFSAQDIRAIVAKALSVSRHNPQTLPIGAMEINDDGIITFANHYARKTLGQGDIKLIGANIWEIVQLESNFDFSASRDRWVSTETKSHTPMAVSFRTRATLVEDKSLLVFLTAENTSYMFEPIVYELLNAQPPKKNDFKLDGHLLVIDDFPQIRRVAAAILREFNCICHTARSQEEAFELFQKDEGIKYVIIDLEMPGFSCQQFIKQLRAERDGIKIIGSCSVCDDELSSFDVDAFLPKPWSDEDLLQVLSISVGKSSSSAGTGVINSSSAQELSSGVGKVH